MMINKRLIGTVEESRKYVAGNVILQWCSLAANIAMMTAITKLLASLLEGTADGNGLMAAAAAAAITVVIRFVCAVGSSRMGYLSSRAVKKKLREMIYEKLLRLGASYNGQVKTSEVVQVAVEGVDQLETYFGAYLPQFFYAMLAPLTLFAYLSFVNIPSAVVLLVCVPLIPVSIAAVQTWAKKLLSKYWGQYTALGDTFLENLQGLTTLKIYQADGFKNEEMNRESERFRRITMKVLTMQLNSITIMDLIAYGGAALGVIMAVTQFEAGNVSLAGCLLIILLAADFFIPMRQLGSFFHIAMNGMAASDKIFRLLDLAEPERKTAEVPGDCSIECNCLRFSYKGKAETSQQGSFSQKKSFSQEQDSRTAGKPPAEEKLLYEETEILHGVSMEFREGSFISIVGESGCGKSTVAAVLTGKNKGYSGSVKIGGIELGEIGEAKLMKSITYISHQSYLFKGTVRDNLLMGKPDASDRELWEMLERVKLADFLKSENGLDTCLAEKASNLSGGQCQRLALARALLHDSPVYIFDEATSNIDVESENDIMSEIHALTESRKKTVILISHRLVNVTGSDNIYVMEKGRIAQSGSHEALLAEGGAYAKLWNAQQNLENYGNTREEKLKEYPAQAEDSERGKRGRLDKNPQLTSHGDKGKKRGRRSGFTVMAKLIGLVRPLTGFMVMAVTMGLAGHLCASFITILGGYAVLKLLGFGTALSLKAVFLFVAVFALIRAVLRYAEQACNHYIAFKLLALIRDRVFRTLRRLCPAKLEGRDKGDLISIITSDIELLEVFYAHTISPAAIAFLFTAIMCLFIGSFHWILGLFALLAYITVGIAVPLITSRFSGENGMILRTESGELSGFVLDSLRGLSETIQYGQGEERLARMNAKTDALAEDEERMKRVSGRNTAATNTVILLFDLGILFLSIILYQRGGVDFSGILIPTMTLFSSFGPVIALANLGSTLQNTFAAGNRVLDILEETPAVEEVSGRKGLQFAGAAAEKVTFSYHGENVLENVSLRIPEGSVTGIVGKSGSGKSTLLKLFMRFWKVQEGSMEISGRSVEDINTSDLRDMESFMTQETHLFHDSIKNNLRIAKLDATDEEIAAACKKASIHDFIMTLPQGYNTPVGELGDTLSGGERQRLGLARAFLHNAPFLLLDEPTSNLDSLNEAVILKSICEERGDRTVVLVSHRQSTMRIADAVYSVENGRMS